MKVRLSNFVITCDAELLDGRLVPTTPVPPVVVVPPPVDTLPEGYSTDVNVGYQMIVVAMDAARLTAIGVQGKGGLIIAALKAMYPALDVYLSAQDAPVWPGFGSLDVTIDSGKQGWSFRPDGATRWQPVDTR